jgi:hypothetical protein
LGGQLSKKPLHETRDWAKCCKSLRTITEKRVVIIELPINNINNLTDSTTLSKYKQWTQIEAYNCCIYNNLA